MGDLLLVRHGETEWSASGQHTSWTDISLTDHGREQASGLAPLLASHRVGTVFVSPLKRARETAELAGLTGARVDADLVEWDYGGYEGVTTVEIHRTRPEWFLFTDGVAPGPPEHPGESPEEVGARADRMLAKAHAALANSEGSVVLVAHGHVLRVLTARYLGLPASGGALFQLATGTVCRLGTEHGRPVVAGWNVRPPS
ncbi:MULTISPECIES: histidine phosphatase family protein [Streptomyces]|uniref:Putative phosphoglycerate mutase n=1 Tax=Streptomyces stelliscabiei TaxID=146820 RepID=A0A8I0P7X7_9ACTN|nr:MULTISPECIES: histidine phosphatase family protein [Streptomyces]KND40272.1 phosphoglycerate mutase [Streptomyces stelliscabiei]MBE1601168.1 putative phosphoglycerate mutase [Streptomyces stelliscabiei]MDX2517061.1 histidine phosphatase family protein [Streptomyces stelliscabiei]MDX2554904.1 histidine phosphatase family protein [Streptomyces stelliscabiei]MDX2611131.1 histidine phosphatase family protein [Streptomyces stelliscabiei]